jgi:hypothetical protein
VHNDETNDLSVSENPSGNLLEEDGIAVLSIVLVRQHTLGAPAEVLLSPGLRFNLLSGHCPIPGLIKT